MRVGFITSILWSRYGQFWTRLAEDAGARVVYADRDRTEASLGHGFIRAIPSESFRLATAEALALADCDIIITPHPNLGSESRRGGGQDPWIAQFPEVLGTEAGLRNLFAVPTGLDPQVEPLAVAFLQELLHDGWRTRMIMERHRQLLDAAGRPAPVPSRRDLTGVVAQPWLLQDAVVKAALPADQHLLPQSRLEPGMLIDEARRQFDGFIDTDLEVLGAVRWFTRKGAIARITMLVDGESRVDSWLASQARAATHKPFTELNLQDVAAAGDLPALLLPAVPRDD